MKRAVLYVRVSTREQAENLSLETQTVRCREYCRREGAEVLRVFEEPGASAKNIDRPAFKEMMSFCFDPKNKVDAVVVYAISRFSRQIGDFYQVREELKKRGVLLRSATEPISESPEGNFMTTITAAHGQLENEKKGLRSIDGMKAALTKGRWTHQPPTGYIKPNTRNGPSLVPDPERADSVRMLFQMAASKLHSKWEICRRINATGFRTRKGKRLSPQTLNKILRNPIYIGWMEVPKWTARERGGLRTAHF